MQKFAIVLFVLVVGSFGLSMTGCNTIEGAGEDVQAAGSGIEHGAKEVKEDMKD